MPLSDDYPFSAPSCVAVHRSLPGDRWDPSPPDPTLDQESIGCTSGVVAGEPGNTSLPTLSLEDIEGIVGPMKGGLIFFQLSLLIY